MKQVNKNIRYEGPKDNAGDSTGVQTNSDGNINSPNNPSGPKDNGGDSDNTETKGEETRWTK